MTPVPSHAARTPPTSADGSVRNDRTARRVLPNEVWSRRNTAIAAAIANRYSRSSAALRSTYSPRSSGWYSCGNSMAASADSHVLVDRSEVAAPDVGVDVDASRQRLVVDVARRGGNADFGDVGQAHLAAVGRIHQQVLDVGQVLPRLGNAPDMDVVGLAAIEDVADLLALDQSGGRSAHATGADAVPLCCSEIHLDLDLRDALQLLGMQVDDPVDVVERRLDFRGLGDKDVQLWPEDADHDLVARASEDLPDPLLQVGLHVATQPRIAVDDLLHGVERRRRSPPTGRR